MSGARLEKRKNGWALVTDARIAPFGYVRDRVLNIESGDDSIEFRPDDLRRLAEEIEALEQRRIFKLPANSERLRA
jgi:hypothetical protein